MFVTLAPLPKFLALVLPMLALSKTMKNDTIKLS